MSYQIIKKIYKDSTLISPWHDFNYRDGNYYNFVCEIPKLTTKKIEMCKELEKNPLVQDIKNGMPRYYSQPIYWNYGFIPQTWENPNLKKYNDFGGDNDPIDVIEIGQNKLEIGELYKIKILGCIGLIDDNEIDWKIIAINDKDMYYDKYNDINDIPEYIQSGIREWFRWYKYPCDNIINRYLDNEKFHNKKFGIDIIEECHTEWEKMYNQII